MRQPARRLSIAIRFARLTLINLIDFIERVQYSVSIDSAVKVKLKTLFVRPTIRGITG